MKSIRENKFFKTQKIYDNVTSITGLGGEVCYLVEGTERALLIDGLTGVGSLKAHVRELTELPVMLALTHGHLDHSGVIFEYGEGFIHPDDVSLMYTPYHSAVEGRLEFARRGSRQEKLGQSQFVPRISDVVPGCAVKTYPLYGGEVFDLGGAKIKAVHVPGHTKGSLAFIDWNHRVCYSGDCCNINTLLFLPGSTSIEEYRESLIQFQAEKPEFDVFLGGHGAIPFSNSLIDEGIELCGEILAGKDDAIPAHFAGFSCLYGKRTKDNLQRMDGKQMNIAYSREHIWKEKRTPIKNYPYKEG